MKLSIIVPCYNEADNIPLILKRFKEIIKRKDIELILVDNGSTDNSQKVMKKLLPEYKFTRIVKVIKNQGYGFGILSGLKAGKGDFLAWTHADMQTDPKDVIKALDIIESSQDPVNTFVKGNRKKRSLFDSFFTWGMGIFETVYMGAKLKDINAQPNLFHKNFLASFQKISFCFFTFLNGFFIWKKDCAGACRISKRVLP